MLQDPTQRRSPSKRLVWLAPLLLVACGGGEGRPLAAESGAVAPACGTVTPSKASAQPFEWITVRGIPPAFGPAVAEVTAHGAPDALLAPVLPAADGGATLRVPVHPSFRRTGGDVSIRIRAGERSCEPMSLVIAEMPEAPGTMARSVRRLREALDALAPAGGSGRMDSGLSRRSVGLSVFAVPVLWALPALERLERLVGEDGLPARSPEQAETLDAIAARLDLPARMRGLERVIAVSADLAGNIPLRAAGDARATSGMNSPYRFASFEPRPAPSPARDRAPECQAGQLNLFDIVEPAKLDNLMRAQDYAERFLTGAEEDSGGSAAGTVFGDIGVFMSALELLGEHTKVVTEIWDAFSTIVLNTAEAYRDLLPSEMKLSVEAEPAEFEEDSEQSGRWTASAVATSNGMKLTRKILEKVMSTALEEGLGEVSVGKPLKDEMGAALPDEVREQTTDAAAEFYDEVGDRLAEKADEELTDAATDAGVKALLEGLGGEEGPDGFDLPAGCWVLDDMSASDGPGTPPLVTARLRGDAVRFTAEDGPGREYEPADVGVSMLEVRTAEGYRKAIKVTETDLGGDDGVIEVATTYAFGGDQEVATAEIEVHPIEIELHPSIQRVEPGAKVPFVATVRNAKDTRVRWSRSAGEFDEIVDFGEGTHEAQLFAPSDPASFPVRIEVESRARGGIRKEGTPIRKATSYLVLEDPVIDVLGPDCVPEGGNAGFVAAILGSTEQSVRWTARRMKGAAGGAIDGHGEFNAPSGAGRYEIAASWEGDREVRGTREIQVGGCSATFVAYSGTLHGSFEGQPDNRFGILYDARTGACRGILVLTSAEGDNVAIGGLFHDRVATGDYPIQGLESPDAWGAQVWVPCERRPRCGFMHPMTSFDGQIRITAVGESVAGDFSLNGVGEGSSAAGAVVTGRFLVPLGGEGNLRGRTIHGLPKDHPCAPRPLETTD